jgi:8-oxo-dGTP pyrophosphatase MutT (NUDIX family)
MPSAPRPVVTVAAVVERDGYFLLVEECAEQKLVLNQPAGHLEAAESLSDAAARETWEETAYRFRPDALVGVYHWAEPAHGTTFVRFAFCGEVTSHQPEKALDQGIARAAWFSTDEIFAARHRHRSPLVWRCIEDYLAGRRFPLDLIRR